MKLYFFIFSALLFFLTEKSSANPKKVTEELINRVCTKTTNLDLCRTILTNYVGEPIFPQPPARVSAMARDQAKSTVKHIWNLYSKGMKTEMKTKFHDSWKKYSNAERQLTEVSAFLRNGVRLSVKSRAELALSDAESADRELGRFAPASVAVGSRRFKDLCSVLIVLLDEINN